MTAVTVLGAALLVAGCASPPSPRYQGLDAHLITAASDRLLEDTIGYHPVRVDEQGRILPWRTADPGHAYDDVLARVWRFWAGIDVDRNGRPYYMNHEVWDPTHDRRGLGPDQFSMALSSWDLYYNYTGNQAVMANMRYVADLYLAHSLSPRDAAWPRLPFPYNVDVESGVYDGDRNLGRGFLQLDKAATFGEELVRLYKKTGEETYLTAAVEIANTLARKVQPGDEQHSPWPFTVHAGTGQVGVPVAQRPSTYTTNWTGALRLFTSLIALGRGNTEAYERAFGLTLAWMKAYPVKLNTWGGAEDGSPWPDAQINAIAYATYLLEHPHLDADWPLTVDRILQWVHDELDDDRLGMYGVMTGGERTASRQPRHSHSARQAAAELMYWEKTGDGARVPHAIRLLHRATYTVDHDGKNLHPTGGIRLTDGYGDYVRHYLRAMAAAPELAPAGADHLLRTTSTVRQISYGTGAIGYVTFESDSEETFRLAARPLRVTVNGRTLAERRDRDGPGWRWLAMDVGGVLEVRHTDGNEVTIGQRAP